MAPGVPTHPQALRGLLELLESPPMTTHFYRGSDSFYFPLLALSTDDEATTLFAVATAPDLRLAECGVGSTVPLSSNGRLMTVINHNHGIFGRVARWDATSMTLEVRQLDPQRGFAAEPENDTHSTVLSTDTLQAVDKATFAENVLQLLKQSITVATKNEDDFTCAAFLMGIDTDGMHAMPFFEFVFGKKPSEVVSSLM